MGLSAEYGARHLADAPEGRAFKDGLNAVTLDSSEGAGVIAGANAGFARVQHLADNNLQPPR
ncbi:hypothetical protein JJJ17_11360 [Paracoccus caeni]|uniref:Uncharacterized protein n=1 Tax=Paracoccus caeni TaxID=657651 RepID=A0A934W176_9RHOB|nr:hypothetical protein [Paracoccus caeni]MBK4216524.1 hypothetical protein [Paracoccus caeni]